MSKKVESKTTKAKSKKTKSKKVESGNKVSVHYVGTLPDGTEFDNSRQRDTAISFEVGSGQMISGFDQALSGMEVGEVKSITLGPDNAYGEPSPEAYREVSQTSFPDDFSFQIGGRVQGTNPMGQAVVATIDSVNDASVVLNFNHPLAGKTLNFEIELVSIDQGES